jgi:hypothetical protein
MVARRHIHHAHAGWPAPITGVLAALLFASVLAAYAVLLILRA